LKIISIIENLEKLQRDLAEIAVALRELAEPNSEPVSDLSWDEHEKRLLGEALRRAGGNQIEAARILGMSRDRLRYKIAKHGLK